MESGTPTVGNGRNHVPVQPETRTAVPRIRPDETLLDELLASCRNPAPVRTRLGLHGRLLAPHPYAATHAYRALEHPSSQLTTSTSTHGRSSERPHSYRQGGVENTSPEGYHVGRTCHQPQNSLEEVVMAKSYLTREELANMLRTIPVLKAECGEQNPEEWGLLVRGTESRFGTACPGWTLSIPFARILSSFAEKYPPEAGDSGEILFYYDIDVVTGDVDSFFIRTTAGQILQPGVQVREKPQVPASH